jgi:hypothetical protein
MHVRALLTTALALGASANPLSCEQLSTALSNSNSPIVNYLHINVTHFTAKAAINISNTQYNLTTNVLPAFCRMLCLCTSYVVMLTRDQVCNFSSRHPTIHLRTLRSGCLMRPTGTVDCLALALADLQAEVCHDV